MPELLVMRHAKSAWDTGAPTDFDRPLAPRGERDRWRMADWLLDEGLCPDEIVASSAVRARDTAMAVAQTCGLPHERVEYLRRFYGGGVHTWIARLRETTADRLLICGHNPDLDELVELLAAEPPRFTATGKLMTTAAVAHFTFDGAWSELGAGSAHLVQLVRPREL